MTTDARAMITSVRHWHPAAILLIGSAASFVAGVWTYAYLAGDLRARDLFVTGATLAQAKLLLRIPR